MVFFCPTWPNSNQNILTLRRRSSLHHYPSSRLLQNLRRSLAFSPSHTNSTHLCGHVFPKSQTALSLSHSTFRLSPEERERSHDPIRSPALVLTLRGGGFLSSNRRSQLPAMTSQLARRRRIRPRSNSFPTCVPISANFAPFALTLTVFQVREEFSPGWCERKRAREWEHGPEPQNLPAHLARESVLPRY